MSEYIFHDNLAIYDYSNKYLFASIHKKTKYVFVIRVHECSKMKKVSLFPSESQHVK